MQIKNITISNFKNYYGISSIDNYIEDDFKNINLIGGQNGYGKSTICEAVRLCLFGKKLFGEPLSKREYNSYLISSFNNQARKENKSEAFINIELELEESFGVINLDIYRKWEVENRILKNKELKLFRDGKEFEYIPRNYWQDYIESIYPPYLAKFYIFDGEKTDDFTIDSDLNMEIKESLKNIIGLNKHETLYNDLNILKSKIKRRNINTKEVEQEINDRSQKKNNILKDIDRIKSKIEKINKEIEALSDKRKKLEDELERVAGKFTKNIAQKNNKITEMKDKRDDLNRYISEISSSFLPFIVANPVTSELVNQLNIESKIKERKISRQFIGRINGKFSNSLKTKLLQKNKFNKGQINEIEKSVKNTFNEFLDSNNKKEEILHDLTKSEIKNITSFIRRSKININNGFYDNLSKLKNINREISNLNKDIKKTTKDRNINNIIGDISDLESKKGELVGKKGSFIEKKENFEIELKNIKSEIKSLENKIICAEVDSRKIKLISNIQNVIDDFEENVISERIKELENIISDIYSRMSNKDDMVENIKIDENKFNINIYDSNNKKLKKSSLSTGEQEIFALSVLYGLIKVSDYDFPVIIDAPLTSLDELHADNILTKFIPNISDQVILFSTDREIDKNKYDLIENRISKEYILQKSGPDKIKEGYFFEQ